MCINSYPFCTAFAGYCRGGSVCTPDSCQTCCALCNTADPADADVANMKVSFRLRGQTRRSAPTSADGYCHTGKVTGQNASLMTVDGNCFASALFLL